MIQPGQGRGTGGRQPAHGLEIGHAPGDVRHGEHQRDGGKGRQDHPDEVHQQKTITGHELPVVGAGEPPQKPSATEREAKRGAPDGPQHLVVFEPGPAQRYKVGEGKCHHDARQQRQRRTEQVHHHPKKVAVTWNSFSTSRTSRLLGMKMTMWSSTSISVSWCGISTCA